MILTKMQKHARMIVRLMQELSRDDFIDELLLQASVSFSRAARTFDEGADVQ